MVEIENFFHFNLENNKIEIYIINWQGQEFHNRLS